MLLRRPMALADRERIMDYIAKDNPAAAVVHPNYLVIYRIHKGCVEILRVKHAARKQP